MLLVLVWRDKHVFLCGGLSQPQNRPISEIRRFCSVEACPNPKGVPSWRDRHILLCGGLPKPQTVLSRRDKAILLCGGLPNRQNRPILTRLARFPPWRLAQTPKSSHLGEIGTFSSVEACPNPKIVLSQQDKAILFCGGLPKPQNRPILAR